MSDDTEDTKKNVFKILDGGKPQVTPEPTPEISENDYVIVDTSGNEHYATGFLLFTSHHVAIMREQGNGAIPVLVMPLSQVQVAELDEDDDDFDEEIPF
jgi:hypothetical protein